MTLQIVLENYILFYSKYTPSETVQWYVYSTKSTFEGNFLG